MASKDTPIVIQIEGLDDIIKRFDEGPEIVVKHTEDALNRSTVIAQREIKKTAPVDRNRLRNSILIRRLGRLAFSVGTNVKHAIYIQMGTRPHRAPYDPIRRWADRRGIPAYPVWLKIMREGTKANPFFTKGVTAAEPQIRTQFNNAGKAIVKDMNR